MTKLNKTGNVSPFVVPDDEYSDPNSYSRINVHEGNSSNKNSLKGRNEEIDEKPLPRKDKEGSKSYRSKESAKMNIDSIIEEESRQRALNERSSIIPKVRMIEIPKDKARPYIKGVLSAVRDTESKLDWQQERNKPKHSSCLELDGTETSVDQMGFVINQRAAAKHYNPQLTTTEETKPR